MTLKTITPEEAKALAQSGAAIVDVRDADEFARERHSRRAQRTARRAGPTPLRPWL